MDRLAGGNFALDGVEEADELRMPVALHVLADHVPSSTFSAATRLSCRFACSRGSSFRRGPSLAAGRLRAVKRLDLALFVDGSTTACAGGSR